MTDFEMVFMCLLIPVSFVMAYIAGKGDLLFVSCKMLQEKLEEYTDKEIEPNKNPDGWIPCSERLPDENCEGLEWSIDEEDGDLMSCDLLVTYISPTENGRRYVTDAFFFKFDNSFSVDNVIAWQPLPAPYDMRKKVEE